MTAGAEAHSGPTKTYRAGADAGTDDLVVTSVELPAGDGSRIDDQDPESRADRSAYLLAGSRGYVSLPRSGLEILEDRWLSIAETMEFLPGSAEG